MSLNETALACLNRNRLLYLNMLEGSMYRK